MRPLSPLLVVVATVGCTSMSPPTPRPGGVEPSATPVGPRGAAVTPGGDARAWPAAPDLGAIACSFGREDATALRASPALPPSFGAHGVARIDVPVGTPGAARVTVTGRGFVVQGYWATADVRVFAKRRLVFREVVVPHLDAALAWWEGESGELRVGARMDHFRFHDGVAAADVACDDLAPEPWPDVPTAPEGKAGLLSAGARALRATFDGEPVGVIDTEKDLHVLVLERRGSLARIVVRDRDADVIGWVEGTFLAPTLGGRLPGSRRTKRPRVTQGAPARSDRRTCEREVALFTEVQGKWAPVGRITPGGELVAWTSTDGWVGVEIAGLVDARFGVREDDLAACHVR